MFGIFQYRANIKELQKTIKSQTSIIDSQLTIIGNRENTIDRLYIKIHELEAKVNPDNTLKSGASFTLPKDRTKNNKISKPIVFKIILPILEIAAVIYITYSAKAEINEVGNQVKVMLTSMQQFAGDRKEKAGEGIDNLSEQIKKFKLKYGKQDDR